VSALAAGPLWKLDVRAVGYEEYSAARELTRGVPSAGPVCFPSERQVVVTFVTKQAPQPGAIARRGEVNEALPFRLHALFVDTKTGQVTSTREWPTASYVACVVPAPGGKLLVITPDRLMLYSPAVELLKGLDLPISSETSRDKWRFVRSPRGNYLAFHYELRPSHGREPTLSDFEARFLWVDAEKLQLLLTGTDRGWKSISPISVSDDGTVMLIGGKVGKPEGPFHWPCDLHRDYCRREERFIDDHTIFGRDPHTAAKRAYFVSTTGDLLFSENYPKGDLFCETFSADGRRLALEVYKGKGGIRALDIAPHYVLMRVMVYDVPSRRWVYTIDAKKQGIRMRPEVFLDKRLALSPDGSLLALLTQDGVLQMYRLPETVTQPAAGAGP
jgi:hypothetical protein